MAGIEGLALTNHRDEKFMSQLSTRFAFALACMATKYELDKVDFSSRHV